MDSWKKPWTIILSIHGENTGEISEKGEMQERVREGIFARFFETISTGITRRS